MCTLLACIIIIIRRRTVAPTRPETRERRRRRCTFDIVIVMVIIIILSRLIGSGRVRVERRCSGHDTCRTYNIYIRVYTHQSRIPDTASRASFTPVFVVGGGDRATPAKSVVIVYDTINYHRYYIIIVINFFLFLFLNHYHYVLCVSRPYET